MTTPDGGVYLAVVASMRNRYAGHLLQTWRVDRGLSPEQLAWAIAKANLGYVSGRQIRRIETEGTIPTPRVMFALAGFFGTTPTALWDSRDATVHASRFAERRAGDRRAGDRRGSAGFKYGPAVRA